MTNNKPEESEEEIAEEKLNSVLGLQDKMRTRENIMNEANAQNMKYKHLAVLLDIRELLINLQTNNNQVDMPTPEKSIDEIKKYPSHKELDMEKYIRIVEAENFDSMFNYGFDTGVQTERQKREEAIEKALIEYKQFVLNVLDGIDIADGGCNTKAIRFALQNRTITQPNNPK